MSIESPDSTFSLTEEEFKEMVDAARKTEKAAGKVDYKSDNTQKVENFSRSFICL